MMSSFAGNGSGIQSEKRYNIKTMGNLFKGIEGISGATILGDGSVALIIDVLKLMQLEEAGTSASWQESCQGISA